MESEISSTLFLLPSVNKVLEYYLKIIKLNIQQNNNKIEKIAPFHQTFYKAPVNTRLFVFAA